MVQDWGREKDKSAIRRGFLLNNYGHPKFPCIHESTGRYVDQLYY